MNLLFGLLVSAVASQQDLSRLVSAEVRAASAPSAIAELAQQTGAPLEAMPSTKSDILILKIDKVPLKSLMQKIADVTGAEWELSGTTYRLIRNDAIARNEARRELEKMTALIAGSLDKMRKLARQSGTLTPLKAQALAERLAAIQERKAAGYANWAEELSLRQQSPGHRILLNIVPSIPAETLASIPRGRSVVYSNNPNRMQQRLPVDMSKYLGEFVSQQTLWADALKGVKARFGVEGWYIGEHGQDPGDRQVGKLLLKVSKRTGVDSRSLLVRMTILDTQGQVMATEETTVGWEASPPPQAKTEEGEESIRLSGPSKQLYDALSANYRERMKQRKPIPYNLTPALRELCMGVDKTEPLSLVATNALFEVARIKNLNLVACPVEGMVYMARSETPKELKPSDVLQSLRNYQMEYEMAGGWLTVKPSMPIENRLNRVNRTAAAAYLRKAVNEDRVSFDNLSTYFLSSEIGSEDTVLMFMSSLLDIPAGGVQADRAAMKLYASLTPSQRKAIEDGPMAFRALQPAQIELLRHLTFDPPTAFLQLASLPDKGQGSRSQEPTEQIPNGFTGNELLHIHERETQTLMGKPAEGSLMAYEMSTNPASIAFERFRAERPELFASDSANRLPRFTQFRQTKDRIIDLTARFSPRASLSTSILSREFVNKVPLPLEKLPESIRQEVEAAYAELKERFKNAKPPPPR